MPGSWYSWDSIFHQPAVHSLWIEQSLWETGHKHETAFPEPVIAPEKPAVSIYRCSKSMQPTLVWNPEPYRKYRPPISGGMSEDVYCSSRKHMESSHPVFTFKATWRKSFCNLPLTLAKYSLNISSLTSTVTRKLIPVICPPPLLLVCHQLSELFSVLSLQLLFLGECVVQKVVHRSQDSDEGHHSVLPSP